MFELSQLTLPLPCLLGCVRAELARRHVNNTLDGKEVTRKHAFSHLHETKGEHYSIKSGVESCDQPTGGKSPMATMKRGKAVGQRMPSPEDSYTGSQNCLWIPASSAHETFLVTFQGKGDRDSEPLSVP